MSIWFYIWYFLLAIIANIVLGVVYWCCNSRMKRDPEYKQRFMRRFNVYRYVWLGFVVIGIILLIIFPYK